jgi:GxxExxY protein
MCVSSDIEIGECLSLNCRFGSMKTDDLEGWHGSKKTVWFARVSETSHRPKRKMEPQRTPKTQIRASQDRLAALSRQTIGCALLVMRIPGTGFLEKVHENALVHQLRKGGLTVAQQHLLVVRYDAVVVGDYIVDLLVEDSVLVELKVTRAIADIRRAQCPIT